MTQNLAEWFDAAGFWGIFLSLLVNTGVNVIGVVPSVLVTGANVLVWGAAFGGILSWAGEVCGSAAAFWLYRQGVRRWRKDLDDRWSWVHRLNRWPRSRQFVSVLLARLMPFIPSVAVNGLGALTRIRFTDFILATMLGKVPSIALEVLISHDMIHIRENGVRLVTVLLVLLIGWLLWKPRQPKG